MIYLDKDVQTASDRDDCLPALNDPQQSFTWARHVVRRKKATTVAVATASVKATAAPRSPAGVFGLTAVESPPKQQGRRMPSLA